MLSVYNQRWPTNNDSLSGPIASTSTDLMLFINLWNPFFLFFFAEEQGVPEELFPTTLSYVLAKSRVPAWENTIVEYSNLDFSILYHRGIRFLPRAAPPSPLSHFSYQSCALLSRVGSFKMIFWISKVSSLGNQMIHDILLYYKII